MTINDEFSHLPTANARWKARKRKEGLCLRCGQQPAINGSYCAPCGKKQSDRMLLYNKNRRNSKRFRFIDRVTMDQPEPPNKTDAINN